jgi:thiamine biosynthesis lipoprotein
VATTTPSVELERFPAMGTVVEVAAPPSSLPRATLIARMAFAQWDAELSRFRADSELARLNRARRLAVGPLLWEAARRAVAWAAATGGLFDPCLGGQLAALGYETSVTVWEDRCVPPVNDERLHGGGYWRRVHFEPATHTIALPDDAELDLGGIAKGMAVDAVVHQLTTVGLQPVLVNAGGDLAVGGAPDEAGWPIGVTGAVASPPFWLRRGAVATSGTARRQWMAGGRRLHHILDPRTGYPAESGLRQVTVVAGTAEEAEVLAKAAFLEGLLLGTRLIERAGAAARFEATDGSVAWAGPWPHPHPTGSRVWKP